MESVQFAHKSVLLDACINGLQIDPHGIYVDGTAGGAGHSFAIASRLSDGRLVALDQDETAVCVASERLKSFGEKAKVIHANFKDLDKALASVDIDKIDGLLLDLGVSSYQLDTPERGFSYMNDAPLNMAMDEENPLNAEIIVNTYSEDELKRILLNYGEEKFAPQIAKNIVKARSVKPIRTTFELVDIIKDSMPMSAKEGKHHPAKRSFQAIRIEVNDELNIIAPTIRKAVAVLKKGGRIAIITFHSLEDRIVKETFAELAQGCVCPKTLPVCVCGNKPKVKIITKKPILPSDDELENNPRSRSAKLRIVEKI